MTARCPITGAEAMPVQDISANLLNRFWRHIGGVRQPPLPAGARIGLYRAPCGLMFFHPAEAGGTGFYADFYRRFGVEQGMRRAATTRPDFAAGAAVVRPGDAVLDVGCCNASFAACIPAARYQGLDPNAAAYAPQAPVLAESVAAHAARRPGAYDVACAFQVLEHAADPLAMARAMLACLKPGGRLVLAVPCWPSPMIALPNFLVNLPPHHLTWWNEGAALALCAALGLQPERLERLPPGRGIDRIQWAARLCPVQAGQPDYVRPSWRWHAALAMAWLLAAPLSRLFGPPRGAQPIDLFIVARKPL